LGQHVEGCGVLAVAVQHESAREQHRPGHGDRAVETDGDEPEGVLLDDSVIRLKGELRAVALSTIAAILATGGGRQ
jgi:hypothetical protein